MLNSRRAAGIRTLAVILFALVLFAVPIGNASQNIQPGLGHIRITSQIIKHTHNGNAHYIASSLYNKHIAPYSIGNSLEECVDIANRRTLPRDAQLCHIIYRMPLGQIVAMGIIASPVYYKMAIIGGTGVYRNIEGEVLGITITERPHRERLTMTVIGIKEE